MNNYKIRVNNEAESREAQELFFELGYEKGAISFGNYPATIIAVPFSQFINHPFSSSAVSNNHPNHIDFIEVSFDQLRELAKPQGELISGADAKLAWAKGEEVECKVQEKWKPLHEHNSLGIFDRDDVVFRLKPRTVKLEIEVPAPFEPKDGELFWHISPEYEKGFAKSMYDDRNVNTWQQFGAWRTEADIKIVVEQIRKLKEHSK